jgi:hypothetical protein
MIAYLDCYRGINASAMLAALIDAGAEPSQIGRRIRVLHEGVRIESGASTIDGLRVRWVSLVTAEVKSCRGLAEVEDLISRAEPPKRAADVARGIYRRLAQAEARVHGLSTEEVSFHEVGEPDSVLSVLGVAVALELLDVEEVVASPLPTGSGNVMTHHGLLPVPAPATLEILRGAPVVGAKLAGELVTPTGAALVAELASSFGPLPNMTVEAAGYGADVDRSPEIVMRVVLGGD